MEAQIILIIIWAFCFSVIFVSKIISSYKLKKSQAFFAMQILEAKAVIKEKQEYERRLKELGHEVQQNEQVKTLANFYEILNRAAVEYDKNPRAVPSPIAAALLDLTYNYTIIKNE